MTEWERTASCLRATVAGRRYRIVPNPETGHWYVAEMNRHTVVVDAVCATPEEAQAQADAWIAARQKEVKP